MLEYFFNVKHRDETHRQKFVVVSTAVSFLLILGIWIPFQMMRFRTMTGNETVAENKTEETNPSPVVAGDATTKPLPFLTGAVASPIASTEPTLIPTVAPALTFTENSESQDTPLLVESSPEPVAATPVASDFPTL